MGRPRPSAALAVALLLTLSASCLGEGEGSTPSQDPSPSADSAAGKGGHGHADGVAAELTTQFPNQVPKSQLGQMVYRQEQGMGPDRQRRFETTVGGWLLHGLHVHHEQDFAYGRARTTGDWSGVPSAVSSVIGGGALALQGGQTSSSALGPPPSNASSARDARFASAPTLAGAAPLGTPALAPQPWEASIDRSLVNSDLANDASDPYASRVAGIQDSFSGDHSAAFPELRTAIEGGQQDPAALSFGALSAYHAGDMKTASAWARQALAQAPGGPYAKMAEAIAKLSTPRVGDPGTLHAPAARQAPEARTAPAMFPRSGEAPRGPSLAAVKDELDGARESLALGDPARAAAQASGVLDKDADNVAALEVRAAAGAKLGHWGEAERDTAHGLDLAPGFAPLVLTHALAAGRSGRYDAARADALSVLRADPKNSAALRLWAFAEAGRGDRAAMARALTQAAAVDPAAAELLREERALPPDDDAVRLFTDTFLLGEAAAAARAPAAPRRFPKALAALALCLLAGAMGGGVVLLASRGRDEGLDLSDLRTSAPPDRVGPFRLLGAAGGGGSLWSAEDTRLGRLVTLQRVPDEVAADRGERERYIKEAGGRIYSVYEGPEGVFLVHERAGGRPA